MASQILLSDEQRLELTSINDNISEDEIAYYYTLREDDIPFINSHRGHTNRLGFAMTLCTLRHKGWPYHVLSNVPEKVKSYVAAQIGTRSSFLDGYSKSKIRTDHITEICSIRGYKVLNEKTSIDFKVAILNRARVWNDDLSIIKGTIVYAIKSKIILPRITTLERLVRDAINNVENQIIESIDSVLNNAQREMLDNLLVCDEGQNKTALFVLKDISGRWTSTTIISIIDKLEAVRKLDISVDLKSIHPNMLKALSRQANRYDPSKLRRFSDKKRYMLLAVLISQLETWLTDLIIDMNDKIFGLMLSDCKKVSADKITKKGKQLDDYYRYSNKVFQKILEEWDSERDMRTLIMNITTKKELQEKLQVAETISSGGFEYIGLMKNKYFTLRRYAPSMLRTLEFTAISPSSQLLITALEIIKRIFQSKKTNIPANLPTDFLADSWKKFIYSEEGNIDIHSYIVAVFAELKNQLRSGDICVKGSYKYNSFESYLIPKEEWEKLDKYKLGLSVSNTFSDYIKERSVSIGKMYNYISNNLEVINGLHLKDSKFHLSKLDKEVPEEAKVLSLELYSLLPRINLSDILFEVNKWSGFLKHFIHSSSRQRPSKKEEPILIAALTAMGLNIGLQKMADCNESITYRGLSVVSNWRLYDDALKKAQACMVNYQHHFPLSNIWGNGSASSSDGMRVICSVKSLYSAHNPHYGSDSGVTMYRHTSDEYSSFYVNVINTNVRDAVHVIDGILHHESELNIEKHFTDTAGYTDQIFGLTHILGFMFAPRIRDITDVQLYRLPSSIKYTNLEELTLKNINLDLIKNNYDSVLRIAYSIKAGYVPCDLIMSKLGSFSRQNAIAKALQEMGRIEKTIFLLKYLTDEKLRREILIGLNKGEAMNGLARALFFGKSGELRERDLQDQLQRASCLNILINNVVIWNTVYLSRAIQYKRERGGVNEVLLRHVSPLNWSHINLYGKYDFDAASSLEENEFRPLSIVDDAENSSQI